MQRARDGRRPHAFLRKLPDIYTHVISFEHMVMVAHLQNEIALTVLIGKV